MSIDRTISNGAVSTSAENKAPNSVNTVIVIVLIGIGIATLVVLTAIVTIALALFFRKSKCKLEFDNSYSTLCRGNSQQLQPQLLQAPIDLYDQIQLSPSTGQAEVISKAEIENTNTLSSHQSGVSPSVDAEQYSIVERQDKVSTHEQPTYAAVKKKQKKGKIAKNKETEQNQDNAAKINPKDAQICSFTTTDKTVIKQIDQKKPEEITSSSPHTTESPEALYTVVKKKPNNNRADNEEKVPPPPLHSVEELYTAIKKNVKGSAMEKEEGAPQIPPHTVEDLYTAVMKKPKHGLTNCDIEPGPPIPSHTVEELYTAVQKGSIAKNEEEAPPIPPHTVEDC